MTDPFRPTVIEAVDKLEALGSSRQIADFFEQCGIKALRGSPYSCAVAEHLYQETGHMVLVTLSKVRPVVATDSCSTEGVSLLGGPVADFIVDFDDGRYPQLEGRDGVE